MSRVLLPLQTADLSSFAKSLAQQLAEAPHPPGHQSLLNMLARAAGHRNLQSLRAARRPPCPMSRPETGDAALPFTLVARKALALFDSRGRLIRWPNKYSVQRLAMWVLWTRFDTRRVYTEREINDILKAWNGFGDHVTLRRELVEMKLLARKSDCSEYRKQPARPSNEVRALIQAWRGVSRAA